MIELLRQQFAHDAPTEEKLNRTREFLQIAVLKIMYDKSYLDNLAFVGGTALRILFGLRRFSEDLDFSLVDKKEYNFYEINKTIERELKLYGLNVESKAKVDKTVQSTFLKFERLLKDLGISNLAGQKLSIKIEVDSNPPQGWRLEKTLVNKVYLFNLPHFDLPSLYATKLHACFFREFTKGRDFYDLVWYIGKKIKPNYLLLNNAIMQTEKRDLALNEENYVDFILEKLKGVDFKAVKKDVERFLEDKSELKLLDFDDMKNNLDKC
ncbi:MAG: nucleotidyl transferase AbiEii/AbiGii toxin family protein [Candidatus Omnitrophica bacterium]|nr:nucleotidyl transferase AbiEii/AbiGii toxin family protein [Candidatus Omnitrophota bacterium]